MCFSLDPARAIARQDDFAAIPAATGAVGASIDLTDPYVRMLPIERLALAVARAGLPASPPVDAHAHERLATDA